jgi:hypothetical protein
MTAREIRPGSLIRSEVSVFLKPVIQNRAQLYPIEGGNGSIEAETCNRNKGPAQVKSSRHKRIRKRDGVTTDVIGVPETLTLRGR